MGFQCSSFFFSFVYFFLAFPPHYVTLFLVFCHLNWKSLKLIIIIIIIIVVVVVVVVVVVIPFKVAKKQER